MVFEKVKEFLQNAFKGKEINLDKEKIVINFRD